MRAAAIVLALVAVVAAPACHAVVETTPAARVEPGALVDVPFYADLAPYGTWMQSPLYGWVWSPDPHIVGPGFMPYATGGGWLLTNVGWMWMSTWEWGWAPFHYGRWTFDVRHGWLWVPDRLWAPAWVDWRSGHDYVGWAPLPPRRPGAPAVHDHSSYWVFTRHQDLSAASVEHVLVPAHEAADAVAVTAPIRVEVTHDGRSWYAGPSAAGGEQPLKIKPPHTGEVLHPPLDRRQAVPATPARPRVAPAPTRATKPVRAVPGSVRVPAAPRSPRH